MAVENSALKGLRSMRASPACDYMYSSTNVTARLGRRSLAVNANYCQRSFRCTVFCGQLNVYIRLSFYNFVNLISVNFGRISVDTVVAVLVAAEFSMHDNLPTSGQGFYAHNPLPCKAHKPT